MDNKLLHLILHVQIRECDENKCGIGDFEGVCRTALTVVFNDGRFNVGPKYSPLFHEGATE